MSESPAETNARVAAAVDALLDGLDEPSTYAVTLDEIERAVEQHPGPWPDTWLPRLTHVLDALGLAHTTYTEVTGPVPHELVPCLGFREGHCVAWIARRGAEICVATGESDGTYNTEWVDDAVLLSTLQGPLLVVERAPLGHGDPHASEREHARESLGRVIALARLERADLWVVALYASAVGVLSLVTPIAVQQLVTTVAFGALLQPFAVLAIAVFALLGAAGALGDRSP